MSFLCFLSFSIELILVFLRICNAGDAISPLQSLMDGETLISKGGIFELGFFTPGHSQSQKRYLGIWCRKIPIRTVVWVANRETPIRGSSGVLKICPTGTSLVLFNESNETNAVWISSSSLSTKTPLNHPIAQLLDSGNLVLREENSTNADRYMWQSFDYPSDTLLQGMKLGWDSKRGLNRRITSWTSPDDPSPGELVYEVTHDPYPQAIFWKGSEKFYRAGPWKGRRFSGSGELKSNPVFDYQFVTTPDEVYYIFQIKNKSVVSMLVMNQTTLPRQRYIWVPSQRAWEVYITAPRGYCDEYGLCGANSVCIFSESPVCRCLKGFKPKSQERWNLMDWSEGCIRHKPLECGNGD